MVDKAAETVVVRENEIRLVRRPDSDRWQAHFKVNLLGLWIRKATGTPNVHEAREIAEEFWMEAKVLAKSGHPVVSRKFKAVAEVVLRDLEIKVAADKTKRGSNNDYISALRVYLIPFFGSYNIDRIKQEVFTDFCEWRRQKVGRELSKSAQANHNAALSLVFDYGIEKSYLTRLQMPVLKNTGEASGRRPAFSVKEIGQILTYLPTWIEQAREGKSKNLRELLSVYIPFAAATGMRPGTEMDNLEWRHIAVHKHGDDEAALYAYIQKGKTVKKGNQSGAVLHRSCWLLLEKLRQMSPEFADMTLGEVLGAKSEKLLFRMRDGEQPNQLTKQFKVLLKDLDLLKCPITGEDRVLYSLRHHAITRLVAGGTTAEQMQLQVRTSAPMISKHYNHLQPLMNAARFSGQGDILDREDEIAQIINNTPHDNLMHFTELSTGMNLALVMQNVQATQELREALLEAHKTPN